jgi:hypothetical protein
MRHRALSRLVVVALAPLIVAASDPAGDVRPCERRGEGDPPDLVRADGHVVELGTSARWTLTFSEALVVPDPEGHPFRVDIVLHDPDVPAESFDHYRDMNRLVRVDATVERPTEIYLIPERASNVFIPPRVEGDTMRIQVPGRTLSDDEDLTGTSPGLEALRWTVIVRDERACDFLGNGRPTERLIPPPGPGVPVAPPEAPEGGSGWIPWAAASAVAAAAAVAGTVHRIRLSR